jgi:hypothetical protein
MAAAATTTVFMQRARPSSFFGIEPLAVAGGETCHHAMDAYSLCRKRLAGDCYIFMYIGSCLCRPAATSRCMLH